MYIIQNFPRTQLSSPVFGCTAFTVAALISMHQRVSSGGREAFSRTQRPLIEDRSLTFIVNPGECSSGGRKASSGDRKQYDMLHFLPGNPGFGGMSHRRVSSTLGASTHSDRQLY
jgi:hypothetical protein